MERASRASSFMSAMGVTIADDGDVTYSDGRHYRAADDSGEHGDMYGKLAILGSTVGGEKWSVNLCFDPTLESGTWDQAAGDAQVAAVAVVNVPANLLKTLAPGQTIDSFRWEGRDDVTDELLGVSLKARSTPLAGTGTSALPPQCASVFSLRTNATGARGRGRLYWPATGLTLTSSLRMSSADQTAVLAAFQTYVSGLQTAVATGGGIQSFAVRSKVSKTTPHVNRIQLGDVIDTQRRRRDSLPESYASVAYP